MTTHQTWITPQAHERLKSELATLQALCNTSAFDDSRDGDENLAAVQRARRGRIQEIHDLLVNAVVGEDPPNDGIAEPGMVLTVRYDESGETETFLLGVRGAEFGDLEVYSLQSPLGGAIAGARRGEQRSYPVPNGGSMPVTLVEAVPYGLHRPRVQASM
jgi:transcription elongation factor GreA